MAEQANADPADDDPERTKIRAALAGFSKKLRFSVGTEGGPHSAAWIVWARGSDYYFGARSLAGSMKVSLHASGICRVALLEPHIKQMQSQGLTPPEDRALIKWRRPATPHTGAACIASIIFPTDYLRSAPTLGTPKKPMLTLQPAPAGGAVEVGFFYSREKTETLLPKLSTIGQPLFGTTLESGEHVSITARHTDFDRSVLPTSEQIDRASVHALNPDALVAAQSGSLNMVIWNKPGDGTPLHMIDIGGVTVKPKPASV